MEKELEGCVREELEERCGGEDGESGYEDSVSEGVETLTDGTGVGHDNLDTGFSDGDKAVPASDTLESLVAGEDGVESLTDEFLLVSLQETLDGR